MATYEAERFSKGEEKLYKLWKIERGFGRDEVRTFELVSRDTVQAKKDNRDTDYTRLSADDTAQLAAIDAAS